MAKRKPKKKTGEGNAEAPTCHCLLLLDEVLVGIGKHKHILQGIIGTVVVPEFPAMWGGAVVYARVSNIYGTPSVDVIVKRADETAGIKTTASLRAEDGPLGVCTVLDKIPVFPVEKAGRYLLTLEYLGIPLATMPFSIFSPDVEEEK